ncbi:MAG: sialate O-acetylesterase, partial [Phycisphaerales bacterium]
MMPSCLFVARLALSATAVVTDQSPGAAPPVCKVFILAGQSNMEGQGVVDLMDEHHNNGRGTLVALAADPATAPLVAPLRAADGSWRTRDDVFVRYTPEGRPAKLGPLGFGFTPYLDQHHFGPEVGIGWVLGDAIDEPVLLVKVAWGGKSLFTDFRPPSSGGTVGPYYTRAVADVHAALDTAFRELPALADCRPELAGIIWYHGWNDGCDPANAVPAYEQNLVNLVGDLRREFHAPELPVVIGEITGPWVDAPDEWGTLRRAQAAAAARPEVRGTGPTPRACFVPTAAFVRDPDQSPCPGHGHHEFANAE